MIGILVAIVATLTTAFAVTQSSVDPPLDTTAGVSLSLTDTPSSAPTECALKISRQAKGWDLSGLPMVSPAFAIDGVNGIFATGSGYVIFFLLTGNGMIMTKTFVFESLGSLPRVAISGRYVCLLLILTFALTVSLLTLIFHVTPH